MVCGQTWLLGALDSIDLLDQSAETGDGSMRIPWIDRAWRKHTMSLHFVILFPFLDPLDQGVRKGIRTSVPRQALRSQHLTAVQGLSHVGESHAI